MPEKVKKPANPTTNLLQNIRSPRPSQIDENVPKSKHYRSELEPLLGAAITLKCPDWTIFHEEHYTKILVKTNFISNSIPKNLLKSRIPRNRPLWQPEPWEHMNCDSVL